MKLALFLLPAVSVSAFLPQQHRRTDSMAVRPTASSLAESLMENLELPNPFKALKVPEVLSPPELSDEFDPSPAGLVRAAKRVLAADLGLEDPSLLADNFGWMGPVVDTPLSKTDYLAAGRFFGLRTAFPDLDYRPHDFRTVDESTVRVTARVTGTMRGELRLRGETLSPTGKTMTCPPEAITMTFDAKGKLTKLCTGFGMDRLVGNTEGTTGVMAAAIIGGQSVSDWELYPPSAVVARFFGRPVDPLPEPKSFLAPFPETVMIQLAKGILAANMASEDPTLLAKGFTYMTPFVGPVGKKEFLEKYAAVEFESVDPEFDNFRVDPYDPVRVWVDVQPKAPGYIGSPQAMSFTFDDEGFCTRITSQAVMDPTVGNGGGLGGLEGYRYAMGEASLGLTTRPLPRALGRLRKRLLEPFTKVGADDYVVPGQAAISTPPSPPKSKPAVPKPPAEGPKPAALEKLSSLRSKASGAFSIGGTDSTDTKGKEQQDMAKRQAEARRKQAEAAKAAAQKEQQMKQQQAKSAAAAAREKQMAVKAEAERQRKAAAAKKAADAARQRGMQAQQTLSKAKAEGDRRAAEKAAAQAAAERKRQAEEMRKQKQLAKERAEKQQRAALAAQEAEKARKRQVAAEARATAQRRREEAQAAAEAERKANLERNLREKAAKRAAQERATQEAAEVRQREAEAKKATAAAAKKSTPAPVAKAGPSQEQRQQAALDALSKAAYGATIGLFGLGGDDDAPSSPSIPIKRASAKTAPPGVPSIRRWKKNADGSVTGNISGSKNFRQGEKVTTSPIVSGTVASGEVVRTGSGSRYFLV